MPEFLISSPFLGVAVVVIILLLIAFVASRYKVAGANEALIVAGSRGSKVRDERGQTVSAPGDKGVKVVVGGGTLVFPLINRVGKLKLTARQINVALADAVSRQGIKVAVQGVATFKIGRDVGGRSLVGGQRLEPGRRRDPVDARRQAGQQRRIGRIGRDHGCLIS